MGCILIVSYCIIAVTMTTAAAASGTHPPSRRSENEHIVKRIFTRKLAFWRWLCPVDVAPCAAETPWRRRSMSAASSHRRRGFDVAPAAAPKEGLHTKQKSEYRFNSGRY